MSGIAVQMIELDHSYYKQDVKNILKEHSYCRVLEIVGENQLPYEKEEVIEMFNPNTSELTSIFSCSTVPRALEVKTCNITCLSDYSKIGLVTSDLLPYEHEEIVECELIYDANRVHVKDHSYFRGYKTFCISDNLQLDNAKWEHAMLCLNDMNSVKPSSVCCICGKILYPSTVQWIDNLPEYQQTARKLVPQKSPVSIIQRPKARSTMTQFSSCATCKSNVHKGIKLHLFDDFGKQPDVFKKMVSYEQYRKLSIGNLYCSTFKNPGYSYLHAVGNVTFSKNNEKNLRGMVGMLQEGSDPELQIATDTVKECFFWLKKNNPLYRTFYANLETMHGHVENRSACGLFTGLPKKTSDLKLMNDGQVPAYELNKQEGLLVPAEDYKHPKEPTNIENVCAGKQIKRSSKRTLDGSIKDAVETLSYGDHELEAKIFPHLFPYGKGSFFHKNQALTLGAYHKLRLLHVDRRWANDRFYPFWAFDRNMKARLFYLTACMSTNKDRSKPITSGDINTDKTYYKYGNTVTSTITGSKSFWTKHWLDLMARVSTFGPGDIFFTITFNEGWAPLKEILSQYPDKTSIRHPVEPTMYFFERFKAIKPLLFGKQCVFGVAVHYWYRVESQNRGALHIHGIVWLKEGTFEEKSVVAEMPRGNDERSILLREKVFKTQIHHCWPNRCFRTSKGKIKEKCKYGFPYEMREKDGYDNGGTRYEYMRRHKEDEWVVPYNPYILMAWDGHINIQRITSTGLERYLVKYISKVEPTFGLQVEYSSEVTRYLESRLIGAPECIAISLSHPMVNSDAKVIQLDTNFQNDRLRPLKSVENQKQQNNEDADVFKPGKREHYVRRPEIPLFENMTYPHYCANYEISATRPKYANPITDMDDNYVIQMSKEKVIRTRFLSPVDGEIFYYQQLLLKIPFRKETATTWISPDNESKTFKEECVLRGIFDYQDDVDLCFAEMKHRNFDPLHISKIAKQMLSQQIANQEKLARKIKELDYGEVIPFSDSEIAEFQTVSIQEPICLEDEADTIEVNRLLSINKQQLLLEKKDLALRENSLTSSQKQVYQFIQKNNDQMLIFISGAGGCGKSYLLRTIVVYLESTGRIVEVLATSGNAAKLIGGQTIHSFFKISTDLKHHFHYRDQTWSAISATDALIVDEVSMLSAELLELMNYICQSVVSDEQKHLPFGGKHMILFGDLFQLPAVVKVPTYRQIYESTIWSCFVPFFLTDNCRQKNDQIFQNILNRVREGEQTEEDYVQLEKRVCGIGHPMTEKCTDLANHNSFVLCAKHEKRQEINQHIQENVLKHQELYQLKCRDFDESGFVLDSDDSDVMDGVKGIMPRTLVMRKGTKVIITRNLDVQGGVTNGTLGILYTVHSKVAIIKSLEGNNIIPVPRVKQRLQHPKTKCNVYRVQFPIILAFACTVHRMQGISLDTAFIYLDNTFFAPGMGYTALSRVTSLENLHLLSFTREALFVDDTVKHIMKHAQENGKLMTVTRPKNHVIEPVYEITSTSDENGTSNNNHICEQKLKLKPYSEDVEKNYSIAMKLARHCLKYNLFYPEIQHNTLRESVSIYNENFVQIQNFVRNLDLQQYVDGVHVPLECSNQISTDLNSYQPVKIMGKRNNIFWNAVSTTIIGHDRLRMPLKLLTVYTLIKFETILLSGADHYTAEVYLKTARGDCEQHQDIHISALSVVLQRNIYIYMESKNEWKIFQAPCNLKKTDYNSKPLCLLETYQHGKKILSALLLKGTEYATSKNGSLANVHMNKSIESVSHLNTTVNNAHHKTDLNVQYHLHPAMLQYYKPVITTGNGNCLWNSISICLIGSEHLQSTLRQQTAKVMKDEEDLFLRLILQDSIQEDGSPQEVIQRYIQTAETDGSWGHEYHILALSILLQRDIYVYISFRKSGGSWTVPVDVTSIHLANLFQCSTDLGLHLFYRPPEYLQCPVYNSCKPCCIFYDAAGHHYTALLPVSDSAVLFKPHTNLFQYH